MNTLDLLYRIYRARYSLDALQRRLDRRFRLVFVGAPEDTTRMLHWLGELHTKAEEMPIEQRSWPVEASDWDEFEACVVHLGRELPSTEWLKEQAASIPDSVPCLWVVEGKELKLPEGPAGTLPRIYTLDPLDPGPGFGRLLPRAFPGLSLNLARSFAGLRHQYARRVIRVTAARNARMAVASSLPAPPVVLVGTLWRLFATAGETIAMTASQIHLCLLMAALHYRSLDFFDRMGELWPVIGGSFGWRSLARGLVGAVPGLGWLSKGGLAYSATWMVGEMSRLYYEFGQPGQEEVLRELRRRSQDELARRLKEGDLEDEETDEDPSDS